MTLQTVEATEQLWVMEGHNHIPRLKGSLGLSEVKGWPGGNGAGDSVASEAPTVGLVRKEEGVRKPWWWGSRGGNRLETVLEETMNRPNIL